MKYDVQITDLIEKNLHYYNKYINTRYIRKIKYLHNNTFKNLQKEWKYIISIFNYKLLISNDA